MSGGLKSARVREQGGGREGPHRAPRVVGRARGYRDGAEISRAGGSLLLGNLELRTVPLDLSSIQLGAVLFYDAGSVYRALRDVHLHHDTGVGLRLVLPQVDPIVFRFDFGVPLDGRGGFELMFSAGLGQAVKLVQGEQ